MRIQLKHPVFLAFLLFLIVTPILSAQTMDAKAAGYFNRGNDKFKTNDFAGAIELYDSALISSQDYRIYYQKGIALTRTNKFEEAIAAFSEVLKTKPDLDLALNAIARAYYSLKNYPEAISTAQKALEKSQNAAIKKSSNKVIGDSYLDMANAAVKDSNFTVAIPLFIKAQAALPEEENITYSLMKAYFDNKDYDNAISTGTVITNNPNSKIIPNTCYYIGRAYKFKGDADNALLNFEKAKLLPAIAPLAEKEIQIIMKEKEKEKKEEKKK